VENNFDHKYRGVALSFSDVLLVPQNSSVASREDVDVSTSLGDIQLDHPIIPTNMSSITGLDMMNHLATSGGMAFCHRFMSELELEETILSHDLYKRGLNLSSPLAFSIGVKEEDRKWITNSISPIMSHLSLKSKVVILIDIAHGDSKYVIDTIKFIKDNLSHNPYIIGGNVATGDGYSRLVDSGADAVRIGISAGSACTTRYVTGHGLPTLASIMDCSKSKIRNGFSAPIIADGGITSSGDIVKSLAFGADAVCVGKLFAGSDLTPGNIIEVDGKNYKEYYGMSSKVAQDRHKGGLRRGIAAEGIDILVPYSGKTSDILDKLVGGIQSGIAYSGATNIAGLRENFEYVTLAAGSINSRNNNWN
jgi:IMP dehydrogenase